MRGAGPEKGEGHVGRVSVLGSSLRNIGQVTIIKSIVTDMVSFL